MDMEISFVVSSHLFEHRVVSPEEGTSSNLQRDFYRHVQLSQKRDSRGEMATRLAAFMATPPNTGVEAMMTKVEALWLVVIFFKWHQLECYGQLK